MRQLFPGGPPKNLKKQVRVSRLMDCGHRSKDWPGLYPSFGSDDPLPILVGQIFLTI